MCVSKTLGEKLQCLLSESIDVKIEDLYQPSLAQADQVPADAEGPVLHVSSRQHQVHAGAESSVHAERDQVSE